MGFYHVMVKYDSFSLPPIGNQGLMDILDMPNTNKYSFEGWEKWQETHKSLFNDHTFPHVSIDNVYLCL